MRHSEIVYLISSTITQDELGNETPQETERLVYANQFYVSSSEFYNAAIAGIKPSAQFEIYTHEYQGEEKLKHNDTTYRIIRAETRGDKTRLVCEKAVGDG